MITSIERFKVIKKILDNDTSILSFDNSIENIFNGIIIESQFSIGDNFILFLSSSIIYENALFIYFLDRDLKTKDFLEISFQYSTDSYKLIKIIQPDRIQFDFLLNDRIWDLQILKKPILTFNKDLSIVKRKRAIINKSYFRLNKIEK